MIPKTRRRAKAVHAWSALQQRRADEARVLEVAESAAETRRVNDLQVAHQLAARTLNNALEPDERCRVPSPRIHVALVGLIDLHYYLGNPDAEMASDVATTMLQTIDDLADGLHRLFQRATKAGGRA